MDFITSLPKAQGKDGILVVMVQLTKISHFVAISIIHIAIHIANLFLREIFQLHELPRRIMSDHNSKFMSYF